MLVDEVPNDDAPTSIESPPTKDVKSALPRWVELDRKVNPLTRVDIT